MRIKESRERGRPRGRYHKLADFKALEYLALISMKYGIDSNALFNKFVEAWECQKSTCQKLLIECRKKTQDNAVFLIIKGVKVVAQFSIPKYILEETNPLEKYVSRKTAMKKIPRQVNIENPQIRDLKFGMNRIKLKAKIIEIPKPKAVFSRFGELNMVTNAKITDETGIIQIPLWNQQIDTVALGDIIQVENARVVTFRGERQLRIGRGGQLSVIQKCV